MLLFPTITEVYTMIELNAEHTSSHKITNFYRTGKSKCSAGHLPPTCYSLRSIFRFHWIRRRGVPASLDGTKPTAAGAGIPEKHDRGSGNTISSAIPTLPRTFHTSSFRAHDTVKHS